MAGTLSLPTLSQEYRLNTAGFHKGVSEVKGGTEKMRGAFEGVRKVAELVGGALAIGSAGEFFKEAVSRAREAQRTERVTAALIKSTGGVAHVTAAQIDDLAKSQSEKLGIDKETIAKGEQVLLTFTNVRNELGKGNDIYNRSITAAQNMSAVLGTDLVQSTRLVGKALQDPAHGMTMLRRAGIVFTDAQKKMIGGWVEHGKALTAQKYILDQLSHRFGGAAAAAADPMARFHVMWQNLEEQLGQKVLPILNTVVSWIGEYLPKGIDLANKAIGTVIYWVRFAISIITAAFNGKDLAHTGYPLVTALAKIGTTARVLWERVLTPFINWMRDHWRGTLIVAALALAVFVAPIATTIGLLVYAWFHFKTFRDVVHHVVDWLTQTAWPRLQQFFGFIAREVGLFVAYWKTRWTDIKLAVEHILKAIEIILAPALLYLRYLWDAFGGTIISILKTVFDTVIAVLKAAWKVIKGIFDVFLGLLSGDWSRAWDGVKAVFSGIWDGITALLRGQIKIMLSIFSAIGGQIVGILKSLGAFIWDSALYPALSWVRDRISDGVRLWLDIYVKFPLRVVAALVSFGQTVWGGLTGGMAWIYSHIAAWIGTAVALFVSLPHRIVSGFGNIGVTLWNGIKQGLAWFHDRIFDFTGTVAALWSRIGDGLHSVMHAAVHGFFLVINGFLSIVKAAADAYNHIPFVPHITGIHTISEPSFSSGAVVRRPTLAIVGDAGSNNPEVVTPEALMRKIVTEAVGTVLARAATSRTPALVGAGSAGPGTYIEHYGDNIDVHPSEAVFDENRLEAMQRRQRLRSRPIPA